jgi:hypothetical protein
MTIYQQQRLLGHAVTYLFESTQITLTKFFSKSQKSKIKVTNKTP